MLENVGVVLAISLPQLMLSHLIQVSSRGGINEVWGHVPPIRFVSADVRLEQVLPARRNLISNIGGHRAQPPIGRGELRIVFLAVVLSCIVEVATRLDRTVELFCSLG